MMEQKCTCPVATLTTNRNEYVRYPNHKPIAQCKIKQSTDQELISGYALNNLKVNNKYIPSKTWPNVMSHIETYQDFLKRFEHCNSDLYKLYFQCPPINPEIIEEMVKKLTKSIYQTDYSPKEYVSRKENRRLCQNVRDSINKKYEETTYGTYYNLAKEMLLFKDILNSKNFARDNKEKLKKICFCGRTTYYDTIEMPIKHYSKSTLPGPIDRYTLRKI